MTFLLKLLLAKDFCNELFLLLFHWYAKHNKLLRYNTSLASFVNHLRITLTNKGIASVVFAYFFSLILCIPSVLVNPKFSKKISMFGFVRKSDTQTQSQHKSKKKIFQSRLRLVLQNYLSDLRACIAWKS